MGHRLIQRIYECTLCGKIPEDGESCWEMGSQVWCEECCDKADNEQEDS